MYNNMYNTNPVSMPSSRDFTGTSNSQSAGCFPQYKGEFSGVFNSGLNKASSFGNGGMFNGNVGQEYQVANGYGSSSNAIGTNVNGPLRLLRPARLKLVECSTATSVKNIRSPMDMVPLPTPSPPTATFLWASTRTTVPRTFLIPSKHHGLATTARP